MVFEREVHLVLTAFWISFREVDVAIPFLRVDLMLLGGR